MEAPGVAGASVLAGFGVVGDARGPYVQAGPVAVDGVHAAIAVAARPPPASIAPRRNLRRLSGSRLGGVSMGPGTGVSTEGADS